MLLHATCIAIDGRAALLIGPSGSGKSDLALRLCTGTQKIDGKVLDVRLVADDQVHLTCRDGRLYASPPPTIAGKIEARGLGILTMTYIETAEVKLAVTLVHGQPIERMPDPPSRRELLGVALPSISLCAFENSAPAKVAFALSQLSVIMSPEDPNGRKGD